MIKDIDQRHFTRGGGVIRVETWVDARTGAVVAYNLAYVNPRLFDGDNGRVVGFDNAHHYPGFPSRHHEHRNGQVYPNLSFTDFDALLDRFQSELGTLKSVHGKAY